MVFIWVMFIVALAIASVAAVFSITGLVAVFSASAIWIIIMGTVLEIGKVVAVSYGYRFWPMISLIHKTLLLFFVVVLMVITSIGIFGFLSKAHLEKVGPQSQIEITVSRLDQRIESEEGRIARAQGVINTLDAAFERYIELGYVTRGIEQRNEQEPQRRELNIAINEAETNLEQLREQRTELLSSIQAIEIEVGPIRYIAEIIYGSTEDGVEKAVRILIIMIVLTFDPLAILLLISANHAFMNRNDPRVRSEFSILEQTSGMQNSGIVYNEIPEDEQKEALQRVKDFLATMEEDQNQHYNPNEDNNASHDSNDHLNTTEDHSEESEINNTDHNDKSGRFHWLPKKKQ